MSHPHAARSLSLVSTFGLILFVTVVSSCSLVGERTTVAEGVVVDADTGDPLADIPVTVDRSLFPHGLGLATMTDDTGRFRLEWLEDDFFIESISVNGRWGFPLNGRLYPYDPSYETRYARTPEGEHTTVRIELTRVPTPG